MMIDDSTMIIIENAVDDYPNAEWNELLAIIQKQAPHAEESEIMELVMFINSSHDCIDESEE